MEAAHLRLKYVFLEENGGVPALYVDGEAAAAVPGMEGALPERFLESFAPPALLERMQRACGARLVTVLRTSDVQMQEFAALLTEHGGET
ncbi:MAG: hypothetical protein IJV58_04885 [Oscillospiraceae bacterium]|nr:hypothetical protein [Oscillospiraceae bacterium]MBQ9695747.1 hypothetical protein [Oscillospiraceae bacterium]